MKGQGPGPKRCRQFCCCGASRLNEIVPGAGIKNGPGAVHQHPSARSIEPRRKHRLRIAALSTDAGDQQGKGRRSATNFRKLRRMGRPGYQHHIPPLRPVLSGTARNPKVERIIRGMSLKLPAPGVGGAAEHESGPIIVG